MRKKKNYKIYLVMALIMVVLFVLFVGINWLSKKKRTEEKEVQKEEIQLEEQENEEEEISFIFYQEENLSFLSTGMQEKVKTNFLQMLKSSIDKGNETCCVILSNLEALSNRTYRFYIQTNADVNNLYQVIVNESKDFLEITFYRNQIEDIESYGGATLYDNIESIYVYGKKKEIVIDEPTLEEEQEAKAKEYDKEEKQKEK